MIGWEEWGTQAVIALQHLNPSLRLLAEGFSFLGRVDFFLLLLPIVYWCVSENAGLRLGVLLTLTHAVGLAVKLAIHAPRPYWLDARVAALSHESTYAFPSLHSALASAMWPDVGHRAWGRRGAAAGCLLALLIGLSRIYLGVHSPLDVLAGFATGAAMLALLLWGERRLAPALGRAGFGAQVLASLACSVFILALQAVILAALAPISDPSDWAVLAARTGVYSPRDPGYLVLTAGIALGMGAGIACQRRWARFDPRGAWWKILLRLLLGMIGLFFFYKGLAALLPGGADLAGLAWKYVQAALAAYWLIFLAPLVFLKLNLAAPIRQMMTRE